GVGGEPGFCETPAAAYDLEVPDAFGLGCRHLTSHWRLHHRREPRDGLQRFAVTHQPLDPRQLFVEPGRRDRDPACAIDLRVARLRDSLVLAPKLLVELLPGPDADELDRDVPVGFPPRHAASGPRDV